MRTQLLYAVVFLLIFLLLVLVTHYLHKKLNVRSEVSRKFIHVSGGILTLFSFRFFSSHWWVLILCSLAFLLLLFTFLKGLLPGIHKTNRMSFGSIFFPVPVYICFYVAEAYKDEILFYLPIAILTFSDTAAEWGGKRWGARTISFFNRQKTMAGSICFAVSAFIISIICLSLANRFFINYILIISLAIAVISAVVELISLKGIDNLSVPISTLGLLLLLLHKHAYFFLHAFQL